MHGADKGVHPGQATADHRIDAAGTGHAQCRRTSEAVDRGPDCVTGNLRRIGKEQEGPAGKRRVEEVLAGTAEDLLADDHTEADPERDLPQRNARRHDQREQHRGNEETFVDLMPADGGEQHFPEPANDEGHRVNRHEPGGTVDDVVPDAARVEPGEHTDQRHAPAILGCHHVGIDREDTVGLVADVPHAEEHRREGTQPHGDHHAFEVDAVTHMGRGPGYAGGLVEKGVRRLVQGVPLLVLSALFEMMLDLVKIVTQSH